jgi:hypothetical protein
MDAVKERQRCIDIFYGQYLQKVKGGETPTYIVSSLGADKLSVSSHFLVVHISTTICLICWFPVIMSTCGAASPLILVFGSKTDMVFWKFRWMRFTAHACPCFKRLPILFLPVFISAWLGFAFRKISYFRKKYLKQFSKLTEATEIWPGIWHFSRRTSH